MHRLTVVLAWLPSSVAILIVMTVTVMIWQSWVGVAVVQSGSMEPVLPVGSLVVYVQQQQYQLEDVVAYQSAHHLAQHIIVHRITEVIRSGAIDVYHLRGDVNSVADEQVTTQQMLGRVMLVIPDLGRWLVMLRSSLSAMYAGGLVIAVWLWYELSTAIQWLVKSRRQV